MVKLLSDSEREALINRIPKIRKPGRHRHGVASVTMEYKQVSGGATSYSGVVSPKPDLGSVGENARIRMQDLESA